MTRCANFCNCIYLPNFYEPQTTEDLNLLKLNMRLCQWHRDYRHAQSWGLESKSKAVFEHINSSTFAIVRLWAQPGALGHEDRP